MNDWRYLDVEISNWIFLGLMMILSIAGVMTACFLPVKNSKKRKCIKRFMLVISVIALAYVLFCIIFIIGFYRNFPII
jgi:hypothetical protein